MEFVNRMKQKLTEELDNGEPPDISESLDTDDIDTLKSEIIELKHHINSNYTVYVRRLEKRKTKIKELEDYLRKVMNENEELRRKVEENECYKSQLSDCREQLEQLESCQNQELSKVKHMLLSAETALEIERQKHENISTEATPTPNYDESVAKTEIHKLVKHLETQTDLARYDDNVSMIKEIQTRNTELETENQALQKELSIANADKDSMRNSLLMQEIASHEFDNTRAKESESLKLELAQAQSRIETLNLTLGIKDNELKSKKEEIRNEKESNENLTKAIQTKELRTSALELEICSLKESLSERLLQMRNLQISNDKLDIQIEELKTIIDEKEKALSINHDSMSKFQSQCDDLTKEKDEQYQKMHDLNQILCSHKNEINSLQCTVEKLNEELATLNINHDTLVNENKNLEKEKASLEKSIPGLIQTSELVRNLQSTIKILEDELESKGQLVRHLQIRANEMKKMLQKELKPNPVETEPILNGGTSVSTRPKSPSPICDTSTNFDKPYPSHSKCSRTESGEFLSEINVRYLRHVIFKFMISPELEARQMIKAVSTLLQFSNEEEKILQDYLDWKTSWFGSKPRLLN